MTKTNKIKHPAGEKVKNLKPFPSPINDSNLPFPVSWGVNPTKVAVPPMTETIETDIIMFLNFTYLFPAQTLVRMEIIIDRVASFDKKADNKPVIIVPKLGFSARTSFT